MNPPTPQDKLSTSYPLPAFLPAPRSPDECNGFGRHQVHTLQWAPLCKVVPHDLTQLHARRRRRCSGGNPGFHACGVRALRCTTADAHAGRCPMLRMALLGGACGATEGCSGDVRQAAALLGAGSGRHHPPGRQAACPRPRSAHTASDTPARTSPRLQGRVQDRPTRSGQQGEWRCRAADRHGAKAVAQLGPTPMRRRCGAHSCPATKTVRSN